MEQDPSKGRGENPESLTFWGRVINIGIFVVIIFLVVFVFYITFNNSEMDLATINTTLTPRQAVSSQSVSTLPVSTTIIEPSATSRSTTSPTLRPTVVLTPNSQESYSAQISCSDISKVNLRKSPGYVGKNDNKDVISEVPCGELLDLLRQTKYVDDLTWWRVKWNNYEGWVSDHTGSGKLILVFNKPSSFSQSDPAEFVFWYFSAIWQEKDYKFLWENFLTASFQNSPGAEGYSGYTKWWNTVERVDIDSIETLQNDGSNAGVKIQVTFYLLDGRILSDRIYDYTLAFNQNRKTWMFDYP